MSKLITSPDFLACIPHGIEPQWDNVWAPRLAVFPVNIVYAGRIVGVGLAQATYVFDPDTFVDGGRLGRCAIARPSTAIFRSWSCSTEGAGLTRSSTADQS
jgi:hypothetical protein